MTENEELLPTVLLDDVTDQMIQTYAASMESGTGMPFQVRGFLDFLESEFRGDAEIDNLIAVSFIEGLPYPGERGAGIVQALGPKLRHLIAQHQPGLLG